MTDRLFTRTLRTAVGHDPLDSWLSKEFVFADLGAEAVRPLLTFEALNEILGTHHLEPPRLRLHRAGRPVPVTDYTDLGEASGAARRLVLPEALYRQLREGASLVLDGVDRLHPPVRAAADDLMRLVRERAQANLYLIWGDSHGFDTHWDDHDTFVVQLVGTKRWQVHGQGTRPHPMKEDTDHTHRPPEGVVWEGVLRPGHVLHVPRGWWHTVTGTGDVSMHLTFGFTRATGVDWARSLVERLHAVDLARVDLPRFASPQERRRHQRELVRHLMELVEQHDLDSYLAERDARFPRRRSYALPWAVDGSVPDPAATVEFTPILPPVLDRGEGKVTLAVSGRRYTFPGAAEPLLAVLVQARTLTVAELAEKAATDTGTAAALVRTLVRHQLALLR